MQIFKSVSRDNNEKLYALDQASGIERALQIENLFRPVFYLYLLIDHDDKNIILKEKISLLSEIGKRIGILVFDIINKSLDDLINQLEIILKTGGDTLCVK